MRKVNIDLNKYMIYENDEGDLIAAVSIKHQSTMDNHYRNYNHFKAAPDEITIDGYEIVPDQEPNVYIIDKNRQRKFRINELRGTWIKTGK